jgi:hypothetical protein
MEKKNLIKNNCVNKLSEDVGTAKLTEYIFKFKGTTPIV